MAELYFNNFIIRGCCSCSQLWTWSIRSCYESRFTFANDDSISMENYYRTPKLLVFVISLKSHYLKLCIVSFECQSVLMNHYIYHSILSHVHRLDLVQKHLGDVDLWKKSHVVESLWDSTQLFVCDFQKWWSKLKIRRGIYLKYHQVSGL